MIDLFREVFFNVFEWVVCWSNGGAALKAERCIKHAKALKFQKIFWWGSSLINQFTQCNTTFS